MTSCDYFSKQKVSSQDIVNEELQTFNWKEVDAYPSFTSCDGFDDKTERQQCFTTTLTRHITTQLEKNNIVVTQNIHDTIQLKFQISEQGIIEIIDIQSHKNTQEAIPNLDMLLAKSLKGLPKIYPAIKRGQQVKTEFTLPIVIEVH